MNENEFAELAAGHALNALSADDQRRFQEALAAHPEWRERVADDEATAAALGEAVAPIAPPPAVRDRLLAAIADAPQGVTDESTDAGERPDGEGAVADDPTDARMGAPEPASAHGWSRRMFTLAASLVLIVGLGVGAAITIPQLMRPASVVALEQIRAADDAQQASVELPSGGEATAHWSAASGNVVLVAEGLAGLDEKQTYELWFVRGDEPVPAGTFRPDAGRATALLDGTMRVGDVIAVTVEADGGSPTGKPTTDPIIVIPTA